ncbi:helix-turn-helix domain-containing protein [Actinocorallia longicatena]|uniref:HTH hxlR-type domain-containing protein n=1 Tax=Actinocorallia longicatena TaxID=111803 RepID=A0ABP6QDM4_9ACTN
MDTAPDQRIRFDANAYLAECASRTVLTALADKWTLLLVDALKDGPVRFGELRRRIGGITQKSLTSSLRGLERDGMVIRTIYPTIPPKVEYELSPLGRSVVALVAGIKDWAEGHVDEILLARERYDLLAEQEVRPVRSADSPR